MKARARLEGNDGHAPYKRGDVLSSDGPHLRKLLANGLAVPLDDDAKMIVDNPTRFSRYYMDNWGHLKAEADALDAAEAASAPPTEGE